MPRAAHRAAERVQRAEQRVERAEIAHGQLAEGHDGVVGREKPHDRVGKEHEQRARRGRVGHGHGEGDPHAAPDPVHAPGAVVLADERRDGQRQARHGQDVEPVDLHIRHKARHGVRAEAVDARLDEDVRERNDHALHAGRQADADDAPRHGPVQPDLAQRQAVGLLRFYQKRDGERAGEQLADVRRPRSARDAEVQHLDEQQVERDVRHRRAGEVQKRPARVARRVQDARGHVVENAEHEAAEVDAKVPHRVRQDFLRRVHPDEQRPRQQRAAEAQGHAQNERDGKRRVDGRFDAVVHLRAEILRHDDARARRNARGEGNDEVDERGARADGRQRARADEVADDDGVGRII